MNPTTISRVADRGGAINVRNFMFLLVMATILILSLRVVATPVSAAPSITLNPTSGVVGSTLTVSGSGFTASYAVTITYDSTVVAVPATSSSGTFSTSFTVPSSAVGPHTITAYDSVASTSASQTFTVPSPSITLNPTSGVVGSTLTVSGSGFTASYAVTISYDSTVMAIFSTSPSGTISDSFPVPSSAVGPHTVKAYDSVTSATASQTFTVPSPSITLNPTSGVVGSTLTVSGSSFTASSPVVTISYDSTPMMVATTSASGTFSISFPVPSSAVGPHTITAFDSGTSGSASQTFTVPSPSITLDPSSGVIGSTLTVSGSSFTASSFVTISYDSTVMAVPATSSSGTFSTSFAVPSSAIGAHTITATDSVTSGSASKPFTVPSPSITLNPTSGYLGSSFTVSGSGFTASSSVPITYDGAYTFPVSLTASSSGAISGSFTVPRSVAGSHTITATDPSTTASASKTFTVLSPSITLDPSSGVVGSTLTVSGSGFTPLYAVTISYDSTVMATPTSSASGTISVSFPVPGSTVGPHTITAADGAVSASASFTVPSPSITLNPTSGSLSFPLNVSGSGFSASSMVVIKYDPTTMATPTSSSSGAFSISFPIPSSTIGPHTITATDSVTSAIASAPFTVTSDVLHHFIFNTISSPKYSSVGFNITITAKDQFNNTVTSYTGRNTLSDSTGTISPSQTGNFSGGIWNGNVNITKAQLGVTINTNQTGTPTLSGTSNAFEVSPAVPVNMVVSYSIIGGGSPVPPVFVYMQAGHEKNQSLSTSGTTFSVDLGSVWYVTPNPLSGSGSSERWLSTKSTSGVASAQTIVLSYYHQFTQTIGVPTGSTMTVGSCDFGLTTIVKTFTGHPQVTLAAYPQNPQAAPSFTPLGKYVQVQFSSTTGVIETELRVCYPASIAGLDQSTFKVYWWGGGTWQACSISNVNFDGKYAWARITPDTTPNLSQLKDALFVGGGKSGTFTPPSTTTPPVPPTSSPLYPAPTATPTWGAPSARSQKVCIIATATYGSEMAPEVIFMRHVRDDMIGSNEVGRSIVNGWNTFYYSWSTPLAQQITTHSTLQPVFRVLLLPLVGTIHATANIYDLAAPVNLTFASMIAFLFAAIASTTIYIVAPLLTMQTICRKRFNMHLRYR